MPVYEYRCEKCEQQFEATQSVHARPEDTVCPHCRAQSATRICRRFPRPSKGTITRLQGNESLQHAQ